MEAGRLLVREGLSFDLAFTSLLKRAIRTLWIVLDELERMWIPVHRTWRLNERHYGALQGLHKGETARKFGEEQVHIWRRSYAVRPPDLDRGDERHPGRDPRYHEVAPGEVPSAESLKDTVDRFLPCWHETIAPAIISGADVIIVAHGNSLRALVKFLDEIPDGEIPGLNIPTGIPLIYELDDDLKPISHRYLGDPDRVKKAKESVADQGKA